MSVYKKVNLVFLLLLGGVACFSILLLSEAVRDFFIVSAERFLVHRPLTHEVWHARFLSLQQCLSLYLLFAMFLKSFSAFFVARVHNSFINFLRVLACMMVYFLHASIYTNSRGTPLFTNISIKMLQTPAWGGVWIFFILGGYLAGKGFLEGRYSFDMKSICQYYKNKFVKIIIPTFSFIFLCCVLVYPMFIKNNPVALYRFLTLSYNGGPGVDGIGATWYVFAIVPLYLLAPVFCFIAIKIAEKKTVLYIASGLLVLLGFFYRFFAVKYGLDWYAVVYTPFYANIDLFLGGIFLSLLVKNFGKKLNAPIIKDISLFALLVFVLINSICYEHYFFYQVFCPSVYLLLGGGAILAFSDEQWTEKYGTFFEKVLVFFSSITFEFYLFHSLILHTILPAFGEQNVFLLHAKLLVIGFVLTTICAIGFKRIFARR